MTHIPLTYPFGISIVVVNFVREPSSWGNNDWAAPENDNIDSKKMLIDAKYVWRNRDISLYVFKFNHRFITILFYEFHHRNH